MTWFFLLTACHVAPTPAPPPSDKAAATSAADNVELRTIFQADQDDRRGHSIDWGEVGKRDAEREARVNALLVNGEVRTGADYHRAAMVFQHAQGAEGIEVAHELAMIAVAKGYSPARWLAAASYDRLLVRLGRGQRFGTQYSVDPAGGKQFDRLDPGVTDRERAVLNCPPLKEAEARADAHGATWTPPADAALGNKPSLGKPAP